MLFLEYPPCSTCKKARAWLDAHGVMYTARHIKEENPTYEELKIHAVLYAFARAKSRSFLYDNYMEGEEDFVSQGEIVKKEQEDETTDHS